MVRAERAVLAKAMEWLAAKKRAEASHPTKTALVRMDVAEVELAYACERLAAEKAQAPS